MPIIDQSMLQADQKEIPTWPCAKCRKGLVRLKHDEETFEKETYQSSFLQEMTGDQNYEGKFAAILTCSNGDCQELVMLTGKVNRYAEVVDHTHHTETEQYFYIDYVNPPPHIFSIGSYVPESVRDVVIEAFKLYWIDIASSANKIRLALEIALSNKYGPPDNKSLHRRIEDLYPTNETLSDRMMSIKWMGNSGSHEDDKGLNREDLLMGFEILEIVLVELFNNEDERIKGLSDSIVSKHNPHR